MVDRLLAGFAADPESCLIRCRPGDAVLLLTHALSANDKRLLSLSVSLGVRCAAIDATERKEMIVKLQHPSGEKRFLQRGGVCNHADSFWFAGPPEDPRARAMWRSSCDSMVGHTVAESKNLAAMVQSFKSYAELPQEILMRVFDFCSDGNSIRAAAATCTAWRDAERVVMPLENERWRKLVASRWPKMKITSTAVSFRERYRKRVAAIKNQKYVPGKRAIPKSDSLFCWRCDVLYLTRSTLLNHMKHCRV